MKIIRIIVVIIALFLIVWFLSSPSPDLHEAIKQKNVDLVRKILEGGTDANIKDSHGLTALHICTQYGNVQILKILIKYGADVNAKTNYDVTPLHFASQGNDYEMMRFLLLKGASIESIDDEGMTPLDRAAWSFKIGYTKSKDILELLELHTDAAEIWKRVNNKEDYKKVVEMMRYMDIDEFNSSHYIKRTRKEILQYLNKLKDFR